jgi:hypothetical protein
MDTLEKLRRLAIDQTHPGPACKPGEHYDSEAHHCVKVPAAEKAKDKPEKHQASGNAAKALAAGVPKDTAGMVVALFEAKGDGTITFVIPGAQGGFKSIFRDVDAEQNAIVYEYRRDTTPDRAIAHAQKDIGVDGKRIF